MPNTNNKKFWERVAKLYAPFMKSSDGLYEDISQRIRLYLKEDMGVLELACGSGQLSFRLAKRVKLWEATDFSPKMIAEAGKRPHSSRLHFSVQDAASLPYADGTFDAIVIAKPTPTLRRQTNQKRKTGTLFISGEYIDRLKKILLLYIERLQKEYSIPLYTI